MYRLFIIDSAIEALIGEETQPDKEYVTVNGNILDVRYYRGMYSIEVTSDIYGSVIFNLSRDVFVFDLQTETMIGQSDLKRGMNVVVIMPKDAIMTMSLPPQTPSAVGIIVKDANTAAAFDTAASVMYCDLKEAAEEKGYRLQCAASDDIMYLLKDDVKIALMIGNDEFELIAAAGKQKIPYKREKLEAPPIFYGGETMVPRSFIEALE